MNWMRVEDFEARYRADPDPWGYTYSEYERGKYAATLEACGPGPFTRALELGSSIGVFTAMLAPACRQLVSIDASSTAVADARHRLAEHPQARPIVGRIPDAIPSGSYDLVLASEILYYLTPEELDGTLSTLGTRMTPGARLVAVHWRPSGPERPFDADTVHAMLAARPELESVDSGKHPDYRLDVLRRR